MYVEGTTVIDNVTGERYEFLTPEFAYSFAGLWNKYERDKLNLSGSTITFKGDISVAPTCYLQFNLGDSVYRLDVKKNPTLLVKMILWMLGFRKVG